MTTPLLFQPLRLRGVELPNRVVISPMCQYSATDGMANDWHFAHLARFALGGAGIVFTEATAVQREGRITHGDLGIWSDAHVEPLRRIAAFLKSQGSVPAMQLGHAGRKASMQRPWHGNGPLDSADHDRGERPWTVLAPSAIAMDEGWLVPQEMRLEDIEELRHSFREAARRALEAGFEVIELHGAHGYLLHEFLSPLSNTRSDAYGGSFDNRVRLALELAADLRAAWPADKPLFFRVSSVDGVEGGWTIEDTVVLARRLKSLGVDVMDCSSGGLLGSATAARVKRFPGFQVPYAAQVRREAAMPAMAVGLILDGRQAETVLAAGEADLIAVGREALNDPNWALHAREALDADPEYTAWPVQTGWWLDKRCKSLAKP
ncbi:MAG: NADH:flavin oxidoreductase/NADH oxidase [Betaproteobacteria bacterium]|jgi:2,4-dienoyl-CoA reductase-like NADH-dependent reductase (Old Yellow Enzyme family)|nr:NADH:flavin oxidoreductase/NADH oxidase [Rhodocyclaceae bacterium]MCA3133091.1 NADH:flavin oxidoreductase/NADH oxidase [Rhodocyclaceae bacterium]MCA3141830.1 NADH:flavin oxidoreductase/NADH oxidase [Rhodocyclaceae bacterium]MCA3144738.1 NADH:flavin oxidoreductase/NADH oxidase [Rhodocyclaceae bacterium]MCE2896682.1 NADH:flavin oxidoreductase/NADH oxidase [Betaproteobacteria bacterium]